MCSSIINLTLVKTLVLHQWINQPNISFALQADGLAIAMILLTLAPYHYILFFENEEMKAFYALTFMAFAMAGTFLASDGLLYYIFWELSLIPIYFIAPFGNVMLKNVKAV
jgi:NADH-quinone oxidoreductase subunit M